MVSHIWSCHAYCPNTKIVVGVVRSFRPLALMGSWLYIHLHVRIAQLGGALISRMCGRGYNSRAGVITLKASVRVGTILGREQIEGGNYSRKYSIYTVPVKKNAP